MSLTRKISYGVFFLFCLSLLYAVIWFFVSTFISADLVSHFYREIFLHRWWGALFIPIYFSIPIAIAIKAKKFEAELMILIFLFGTVFGISMSTTTESLLSIRNNLLFYSMLVMVLVSFLAFSVSVPLGKFIKKDAFCCNDYLFSVFFVLSYGLAIGNGFVYSIFSVIIFLGFFVGSVLAGYVFGVCLGMILIYNYKLFKWVEPVFRGKK